MSSATGRIYRVFCDVDQQIQGNTSAVLLSESALEESQMKQIASDMAQPATTFLNPINEHTYRVRWYSMDQIEIKLCGHGAMAAVSFLSDLLDSNTMFHLETSGDMLSGQKSGDSSSTIYLDPIPVLREVNVPEYLEEGFGVPVEAYFETNNKHIVLVKSQEAVRNLKPKYDILRKSETFAYAVTAPGNQVDFVSRTFVPHVQQLEDPATGSSHASLAPFWADKLGKKELTGLQLSTRGGKFLCKIKKDKIELTGDYAIIMEGKIHY